MNQLHHKPVEILTGQTTNHSVMTKLHYQFNILILLTVDSTCECYDFRLLTFFTNIDVNGAQRLNPNNSEHPLTFSLASL